MKGTVLLTAIPWSRLSRAWEADGTFNPPAPRRVIRINVVQAVANREVARLPHLVIDLAEDVQRIDGIRVEARRNRLPGIPDLVQPGVDDRDVGIQHGDESVLIEIPVLEVPEEERPVLPDRPAEAEAVLLLRHRQRRAAQRIVRVEVVVAEIPVDAAMRGVGSALRDHVHVAGEGAAEFRLSARRHHLELLHRVHAVGRAGQAGGVIIGRQPVHDVAVREVPLAADRQPDTRDRRRLGEQLGAADVRHRHARDQQGEVEEIAPVERNRLDFRLRDGAGDLTACGFDQRRRRGHRDRIRHAADAERHRHFERRTDAEDDGTGRLIETLGVGDDFVGTDLQVRKPEPALVVGERIEGDVGLGLAHDDGCAANDRALCIGDDAADGCLVDTFLGLGDAAREGEAHRQTNAYEDPGGHGGRLPQSRSAMICDG